MKKILFLFVALIMSVMGAMAQGTVDGSRGLKYSPALDGEGNFQNGTRFYTIECARQNGKFFGSAIPVIRGKKSQATTDDAKWAIMPTATEGQYQLMNKQSKKVLTFASTENNAVASMTENLSDTNSIMEFVTANNSQFAADYECFKIVGAEAYPNDMDGGLKVWTSSQALWGWGNNESNPGNGDDGSKWKFTEVEVINNVAVESVTLNVTSANLNIGQLLVLTATVAPAETTQAVAVVSDNEAVARVVDGKIQAISEGTATITVTSEKDPTKTATCEVTVTKQDWYIHVSPEMGIHPDGGRVVSTITLNGTDIAVPSYSYPYVDLTAQKFTVEAGASVQVGMTNIGWMHSMFYVDTDEDRQFTEGEMVTHSTLTGGSGTNAGIAAFTAPAAGTYRMRFKTDWHGNNANGNDPAGRIGDDGTLTGNNSIWANRGVIIDVMLEVVAPTDKATVTYNYIIDGVTVKSVSNEQTIGETVAAPAAVAYATLAYDESLTVDAAGTSVDVTVNENLPFVKTTNPAAPVWGLLHAHSNQARLVYASADGCYDTGDTDKDCAKGELTDAYAWYITGNVIDGFKFWNKGVEGALTATATQATISAEGTAWEIRTPANGAGKRNFKNGFCLYDATRTYVNTQGSLAYWSQADEGSTFEFEVSHDVVVSEAKYATLYYHTALTVPTGMKAYTLEAQDDLLVATEVSVVPAGVGVVLEAEAAGTYTFPVSLTGAAASTSALSGRYVNGTDGINENTYVLAVDTDGAHFAKFTGSTLGEFKAYYQAPAASASNLRISFDELTSIISAAKENGGQAIFDLQGRRVVNAQNGLYIVNGKKVIR